MAIIGIDLGTTNSLACVWRNHKAELIPDSFGDFLTPSVVSIKKDEILVGKLAKERLITHPKETVAAFKRDMGTSRVFQLGKRSLKPEELSSFVLRKLIQDAQAYLQEDIEEAIISVPAYFNDDQRWATKAAGALAGIKVDRIINEPSAAALAQHLDDGNDKTFLVVDFGGGTLDISVVDAFDNIIEIAAVAGDNHLGGEDFNEVIADAFLHEHHLLMEDLGAQEKGMLMKQAEICKCALSKQEEAEMKVMLHDKPLSMTLTNKQLILLGNTILKRMEIPLKKALKDACHDVEDIDDIILVGGSCKMPVVAHYIEYLTQHAVTMQMDPDKAVAIGCGVAAGIKERKEEIRDVLLSDICPFTLGIAITPDGVKETVMSPIIERNTVLPCSKESIYTTVRDGQTHISVEVFQGENFYTKDNHMLGQLNVLVPKRKKGEEEIRVRLTYDMNGILEVDVNVLSTGEQFHKMILSKNNRMSQQDIAKRLKELKKLKIHPRELERNRLLLERGKRLYCEATGEDRDRIAACMTYFEAVLEKQDIHSIDRVYAEVKQQLDDLEGVEQDIVTYFQA